ncbi:4-hydroxybenzoate octaprenyltransferase [Roseicyclus sp. F158]|uniref:4-hydroxybenzoate octaprenyltransferase n=1 Tax=Tropicimonas omnivorans TaxID=3075590 RepID=A0ABU3DCZ5_9RHOB|nr:4-hydroxybenzoate octaprenyltransferase [Roseicyclus sp. F158]MDT0681590.1 4-hydroxybenzoate octaprenyltransferase [Roseicyclus sp. F158]
MTDTAETPETAGHVADSFKGHWVNTRAPAAWRPYLRMARIDRPIGWWLLLLPCWWGTLTAALATGFRPFDLWLIGGTFLGAVLMRGAGCTWNDITDRHIDGSVARTRSRPIPSGQVSVKQAIVFMAAQALVALLILLTLGPLAIFLGVLSLALVAIYPFAKRFTWWPQVFLGLAFNWGALLTWAAHTGSLSLPPVLLYLAGISWTLFYDTIYAHQDAEDDALIGVKSTARLFGDRSPVWLQGFAALAVVLMSAAVILAALPDASPLGIVLALGGAWGMGWHMAWQLMRFRPEDGDTCLMLFRSNRNAGLIPVAALILAVLVR